jgi:hypothetical protein
VQKFIFLNNARLGKKLFLIRVNADQGDQIGRIFAQSSHNGCMFALASYIKITEVGHIFGILNSTV